MTRLTALLEYIVISHAVLYSWGRKNCQKRTTYKMLAQLCNAYVASLTGPSQCIHTYIKLDNLSFGQLYNYEQEMTPL